MTELSWNFAACYPARDCLPHDPGPELNWNESSLLHWYDLTRGVAGFLRFGYQPRLGIANYQIGLCMSDGTRFRRSRKAIPLSGGERASEGYSIDACLHVANKEGRSRWKVLDPACELELEMAEYVPRIKTTAAWGFENEVSRADAADHYEVAGFLNGTVRIGRERHQISCLGYRDHSWGPRSWAFANHRFFSGSFGPDFTYSIATVIAPRVGYFQGGYIAKDGIVAPTMRADVVVQIEDDGITCRGGTIVCDTRRLGRFRFEVEAIDCVLLETDHHISAEALSRVICGERVGTGNLEVSQNPRDGRSMPPVIIGAAVEDGITKRSDFRLF